MVLTSIQALFFPSFFHSVRPYLCSTWRPLKKNDFFSLIFIFRKKAHTHTQTKFLVQCKFIAGLGVLCNSLSQPKPIAHFTGKMNGGDAEAEDKTTHTQIRIRVRSNRNHGFFAVWKFYNNDQLTFFSAIECVFPYKVL